MNTAQYTSKITHGGEEAAECCMLLSQILTKAIWQSKRYDTDDPNWKEYTKKFFLSLDLDLVANQVNTPAVKAIALSAVEEMAMPGSESSPGWKKDFFNQEPADRDWNWKKDEWKFSPTRTAINPG